MGDKLVPIKSIFPFTSIFCVEVSDSFALIHKRGDDLKCENECIPAVVGYSFLMAYSIIRLAEPVMTDQTFGLIRRLAKPNGQGAIITSYDESRSLAGTWERAMIALFLLDGILHHQVGSAGDDFDAVLIGDDCVYLDAGFVRVPGGDCDGGSDGVAEVDRGTEVELLFEVDGAGAGQLGAEDGRDGGGDEGTVGDAAFEEGFGGVGFV